MIDTVEKDIAYLRHQLSFLVDSLSEPIKEHGLQISFDAILDEIAYIIKCEEEDGEIGLDDSEHTLGKRELGLK